MAKQKTFRTESMHVNELKEHPKNPRYISDEKLDTLADSLKEDDQLFVARPIIASLQADGSKVILAGHQRYKATIRRGIDYVPVFLMEGLTEEDERRIMLKDNADNYGSFDWAVMTENGWIDYIIENNTVGVNVPEEYLPKMDVEKVAKEKPLVLQDFTLYFANVDEQHEFNKFLAHLRNRFSAYPSVSKRVLAFVAELYEENNQLDDSELLMRIIRISNNEMDAAAVVTEKAGDYGDFKGQL